MKLLLTLFLFSLTGCYFFSKSLPNEVSGSFVYYDYYAASEKCEGDCIKDDQVIYLFKTQGKSFTVHIKNYDLVKVFFDSRKAIPYEGSFKAQLIFNQMNQIDQFKIRELDDQPVNISAKAKGVN